MRDCKRGLYVPRMTAKQCPAGLSDACASPRRLARECPPANARDSAVQPISVDWWCTMTRRASPEVAGAHTLDSSDAPPSQRTR